MEVYLLLLFVLIGLQHNVDVYSNLLLVFICVLCLITKTWSICIVFFRCSFTWKLFLLVILIVGYVIASGVSCFSCFS